MATSDSSMNINRIALIVAALLAIGAIGVQVYRSMSETSAPDTATTDAEEAPSVDEVIAGLEKKLQDKPDDAVSWRMLG